MTNNQPIIIDNIEYVTLIGPLGRKKLEAKIDTGAYRSSFDTELVEKLGLLTPEKIISHKKISNSLGESTRPVVAAGLEIKAKLLNTEIGVMDRKNLRYRAIIGRKDLAGFLVRPNPDLTH